MAISFILEQNATKSIPNIGISLCKKNFSMKDCFDWLHEKNIEFKKNIRGMVNYEYNRLLEQKALRGGLIPGGENFEELGRDQETLIIRPDLYYQAYKAVISNYTTDNLMKLNISTSSFFDLLHEENLKYNANVRGLVNQKYNQLLCEMNSYEERIPGNDDLECLSSVQDNFFHTVLMS